MTAGLPATYSLGCVRWGLAMNVVSYDIVDDKRRARVAKVLSDVGSRVQFSVFELDVNPERLSVCLDKVKAVIDPTEDSVRVYGLCQRCAGTIMTFGKQRGSGWPEAIVV